MDPASKQRGNIFRVGVFLDFVSVQLGSPHVRPMWALATCGEPAEIELTIRVLTNHDVPLRHPIELDRPSSTTACWRCTRRGPFNFTPMGVNPISSGSPHVRPMGRTRGEPDEIKKNTHPKSFTALFREQAQGGARQTKGRRGRPVPQSQPPVSNTPTCRLVLPVRRVPRLTSADECP